VAVTAVVAYYGAWPAAVALRLRCGVRPAALLVGEDNPLGADPRAALFPRPRGRAGDRLRRLLDLTDVQYLAAFARANLCAGRWDAREARVAAEELADAASEVGAPLVLLGRKVAGAFGLAAAPPFSRASVGASAAYLVPHPSGRCREWNDPASAARLRSLLAGVLGAAR
jgi:hypothetical protein